MSDEELSIGEIFGLNHPVDIDQNKPVLVVEDQQNMRLIIAHHLQKLQFKNVVQAANGLEAMEKLRQHKDISAVICNWEMPSMNGLHLIAEMRENAHVNRIPFCLMISNVSKEKIMLAIEHGVDDMLVKPIKLVDLVPKIRNSFKVFYNKSNPEPVYELAKKAINDSNWEEAERIYRELSIASPNTARPLVGLAKVAWGKKELGNALNFLEEAESNNPNYVHLYSYRGKILAEQGKLDEGLAALKHAISLSPLNPIRYQDCVNLLIANKRYEEVTAVLEGAVKEDVQFPELYKYFSEAYYNLKDYKKAIKYIRSAVGLDPENVVFLNQLAVSLKESGDHTEAHKTYNKVLKLDPKNLQALYNKAILLYQTGQLSEAVKLLERTCKVHPDFKKAASKLDEIRVEVTKAAG